MIALRNRAYERQWFKIKRLPSPTLSVGNIAACGMGKTPVVQKLSQELLLSGYKPIILTRGYKSLAEKKKPQRLLIEKGAAKKFGDEPVLLAKNTGCSVYVSRQRFLAGQKACQEEEVDYFILDDGMQHRQLYRDMEIVLVDAKDPFLQHQFLPYGWLRDSTKRLKEADFLITTSIPESSDYSSLKKQLAQWSKAPLIAMRKTLVNANEFPGKIGVFCGVAHPEQFLETLRDLNQEIVDTLILADHEAPSLLQLKKFAQKCLVKGARALVCTEKDAVKWTSLPSLVLPLIPAQLDLEIQEGKEHWHALIEQVGKLKGKKSHGK